MTQDVGIAPSPRPVGPCARPVALWRSEVHLTTGEVLTRRLVERRCRSRLSARCASCSGLYAGDARNLIRSGLADPDTGVIGPLTFVTLTAPGASLFGRVHSQRRSNGKKGKARRCACGKYHRDNDPRLGTPVNPGSYRYDLAASYNAAAGRLAAVTWQKLARVLGRDKPLRVARVMEYQARGLVHVHALIVGRVSQADLDLVVSGGTNARTGRRIRPAQHGDWSWGPQCRAEDVRGTDARRLGYYVTKVVGYSVKSAGDALPNTAHAARMASAGARTCRCGLALPDCRDGDRIGVVHHDDGTRTPFEWRSRPAARPCRRHGLARRGWGYRGHVFAVSRGWGTTFSALRAQRAAWHGGSAADATHEVVWHRADQSGHASAAGAARRLDEVRQVVTPRSDSASPAAPSCARDATPDSPGQPEPSGVPPRSP